nr:uncharacterized protein LOC107439905 isoform X2 [Parasteatoda tepidariorum]
MAKLLKKVFGKKERDYNCEEKYRFWVKKTFGPPKRIGKKDENEMSRMYLLIKGPEIWIPGKNAGVFNWKDRGTYNEEVYLKVWDWLKSQDFESSPPDLQDEDRLAKAERKKGRKVWSLFSFSAL